MFHFTSPFMYIVFVVRIALVIARIIKDNGPIFNKP